MRAYLFTIIIILAVSFVIVGEAFFSKDTNSGIHIILASNQQNQTALSPADNTGDTGVLQIKNSRRENLISRERNSYELRNKNSFPKQDFLNSDNLREPLNSIDNTGDKGVLNHE